MPPIQRFSSGKLTIPVWVLTEIEHAVNIETAAPRSEVIKAAAIDDPYERDANKVHDYLYPREIDSVQRLRGWNRATRGTIVVDARDLSRVRNVLDTLIDDQEECEDHLDELRRELKGARGGTSANHAAYVDDLTVLTSFAEKALKAGDPCGQCGRCRIATLRDVADQLMDEAGLTGGSYYEAYKDLINDPSAMDFWRTRISMSVADMRAAA